MFAPQIASTEHATEAHESASPDASRDLGNRPELATEENPNGGNFLPTLGLSLGSRYRKAKDTKILKTVQRKLLNTTPGGNPDKAAALRDLANTSFEQYQKLGDLTDLENSLQRAQDALVLIPEGHPTRAKCLTGIAFGLLERYRKLGKYKDLQTSLQRSQEALTLIPEGDPIRAPSLSALAMALSDRYRHLGKVGDLENSLTAIQEAFTLTPPGNPGRAGCLRDLNFALMNRYWSLRDLRDLDTALERGQEALELTPEDHPARVACLRRVAAAFRERYKRLGNLEDLENSMDKMQQIVQFSLKEESDGAQDLRNLAAVLSDRYRRLGDLSDLDNSLKRVQEAVNLIPNGHFSRASCLAELARAFSDRYRRLGDLADLENSLQTIQDALQLTPEGDLNRATYLTDLGVALSDRYERLGELKDLEKSWLRKQQALELIPVGHPDRARYLRNVALSSSLLYHNQGNLKDLEDAVRKLKEAVELTLGNPEHAQYLNDLASAFSDRYRREGDLDDLASSLQRSQESFDVTPEGHPTKVVCLLRLSASFLERYRRLGNINDLMHSAQRGQEALDLTSGDNPRRTVCLQRLAASLLDRYRTLGDPRDLEDSLKKMEDALKLIPMGHPSRTICLGNLALALSDRYEKLRDLNDLEKSVEKTQQALELTPKGQFAQAVHLQNLAISLRLRYQRLGGLKDLDNAVKHLKEALHLLPKEHPERARCLQRVAQFLGDHYEISGKRTDLKAISSYYSDSFRLHSSTPEFSWKSALAWASFAEKSQPSDCARAYTAGFNMLPELIWLGHSVSVRHAIIQKLEVSGAVSTAAKTCIRLEHISSAVELMEQGLAITFQQMLQLKTDVDRLPTRQAERLKQLSSQLYSGTAEDPLRIAIERSKLLEDIRGRPGLQYFLLPRPYEFLRQASRGGPVVILNSHADQCDGIIILNPGSKPIRVALPDVTAALLESQRTMLHELLGRCDIRMRGQSASSRMFGRREGFSVKSTEECFAEILAWSWKCVVSQIYQVLQNHGVHNGRLWWLSTGVFTGMPLHACAPEDRFIHSYTATLGSLVEAYAKRPSTVPAKIGVIGVSHTEPNGTNLLQGVTQEIEKINSILKESSVNCLQGEQATVDDVKLQLQTCSWLHLACHGQQNLDNPTKSCLLLYEGNLELETILQMPLPDAQFVFLAACQTAMGDSKLINESFHLGGGFIAAGFRGSVGTMWAMHDADGPVVAEAVYSYLFRNGEPQVTDAAEALQLAVNALKRKGVPYERWVPFIHMGV